MTTLLELAHPRPVIVLSKENRTGRIYSLMECGADDHVLYEVVFDDTGEVWWVPGPDIRMRSNWSLFRRY